jgi:hypothetical protein
MSSSIAEVDLMRALSSALLALALMALSACAGDKARTDSPGYAAGYSDGCSTGQSRGTYPPQHAVRDDHAFNHNPDYKAGWRAGYNACLVRRGGGNDPFAPL